MKKYRKNLYNSFYEKHPASRHCCHYHRSFGFTYTEFYLLTSIGPAAIIDSSTLNCLKFSENNFASFDDSLS